MNSDYNLEREYKFGEQLIHVKEKIDYETCVTIAINVAMTTQRIDEEDGIVIEDVTSINPLLVAFFLKEFTDADLSGYQDEDGYEYYRIYDDGCRLMELDEFQFMSDVYEPYAYEYRARLEQMISPARVLRDIAQNVIAMEGKDISILRTLLTGLMTNKRVNTNTSDESTVFDMSAYKIKNK